jgi:hypothetical protein
MLCLLRWILIGCLLLPVAAPALGPHEILLLVNRDSPRSVELAHHYLHLRQIPPENIVEVSLSPAARSPQAFISRDDFTRQIWEPVQAALRERRLEDHILALAYSADFPVLIAGDPEVSLTGLTHVRNRLPEAEAIRKGTYTSRLFAGPGMDLQRRGTPGSLEQYAARLLTDMPLPAMLLAHTGSRGESTGQAIRRLQAGVRQQGSPLSGQVFFLTSDDIRTKCRSWQFEDTAAELKRLGQSAQILPLAEATPTSTAWGIMAGAAELDPARLPRLVPGSLAEHLTSYAAIFYGHTYQTKLSAWLQAGAAGSAGTVTEPMSIWTKFPHARMFVHYASGCTLLESLAQAVASPLQLVAVGDPLLAPWTKPQGLTLINLNDETEGLKGAVEFAASGWAGGLSRDSRVLFLLDGRSILSAGDPPLARIDTALLADGWHEVRAVVYSGGAVRHQGFAVQGFTSAHHGRSLHVQGVSSNQTLGTDETVLLTVRAEPPPEALALVQHEQLVARQVYQPDQPYRLDTKRLGTGPSRIQLAALYPEGEPVRSVPIPVLVQRPPSEREAYGPRPGQIWTELRMPKNVLHGTVREADGRLELQAEREVVLARSEINPESIQELAATFTLPGGELAQPGQRMALAFAIQDGDNYAWAAWNGENSAWSLGRMTDGQWKPEHEVGATLEPGQVCILRLQRQAAGGVTFFVNGEPLLASPTLDLQGAYGVAAGTAPISATRIGVWSATPP